MKEGWHKNQTCLEALEREGDVVFVVERGFWEGTGIRVWESDQA